MRRSSTDRRHFITVGVLVAVVTVLLYWLLYQALPLPVQASSQAVDIDWLFQAHMILLSFLFALVVVFMVYAIVVFRRRKGQEHMEGEHFEGNTPLEIAWTTIPLVVVVIFAYMGVTSLRDVTAPAENEMVVGVVGRQWSWTFTNEETGTPDVELVVPVNQPIRLEMEAADVLHSFWVPEFRVKKDLVPGQTTVVRFTPTLEGEFSVVCAEICGLSHYTMVAPVRVVSEAEFAAWVGEQLAATGGQSLVQGAAGQDSSN